MNTTLTLSVVFAVIVLGCMTAFLLMYSGVLGTYDKQVGKAVKVGWIGSEDENSMNFSFRVFDGKECKTFRVQTNSTLKIFYSVVLSSGELFLEVLDPDGFPFFSKSIRGYENNNITLKLSSAGWYTIMIMGKDAQGDFSISWRIISEE